MKRLALVFAALAIGLSALAVRGVANARATPLVRTMRIELSGWPDGAPDITVALLSDIHIGNIGMGGARLRSIVAQVNAQLPDLVVIAGDLVVGHAAADVTAARAAQLTDALSGLDAPLGVLAVLGNHDYWTSPADVKTALAAAHIDVLENASARRGPITIVGVSDAFSEHDDIVQALAGLGDGSEPLVVLTHSPDIAPQLPRSVRLVLAGHTHCGQIVIPFLRPPIPRSPIEGWKPLYDPHYLCGLIEDPGRSVIVTAGLGPGTVPMRFGAPPDWWLVTLGPARGPGPPS